LLAKPVYDEYNDNYEIVLPEQLVSRSSLEHDCFQQSHIISKCAYHGHEVEDEDTNQILIDSATSYLPKEVSLQCFEAYFQPLSSSYQLDLNTSKDVVSGLVHDDSLVQIYEDSLLSYEAPFARFLETISGLKPADFFNKCVSHIFFGVPLKRHYLWLLEKLIQKLQPLDKMLVWIHWIFHST